MANNKNNESLSTAGTVIVVGAAVAAASAAAYMLFGSSDSKKNRKVLKGWAIKMKGEIIENLEKVSNLTEPTYNQVIDKVSARYKNLKDIDRAELEEIIADVKKHWKTIVKGTKNVAKSTSSLTKPKVQSKTKVAKVIKNKAK